jgi:arylsulfatase A-like enzyme
LTETTIADMLREAGYSTGFIGKWNLDGSEEPGFVPPGWRRHGFDYWAAFNRGHRYNAPVYFRDDNTPIRPFAFEPDYQTDLAIDFLRENADRAYFLCVALGPPHPPRTPPERFQSMYETSEIRLRRNVPGSLEDRAREAHAGYYGLCSAIDENLDRLLEALEETGRASETIVVFTSDHGDMLGSHGLDEKNVAFEESVRVPLIVRYPGRIEPGATTGTLISLADLAPTLLAMTGVTAPSGMQGQDLSGSLTGDGGDRPEAVYAQGQLGTEFEWRMLVRGLDKVIADRELRITHLFNLGQDPYELANLVGDPEERRKRDEMRANLIDWMGRLRDGAVPSGLRLRE